MEFPEDLKYTKEHEWARRDGNRIVIGITDFAQDELGDIVYVELPQVGATVDAMSTFGVVESTKAVSDLYAPISGTIVETNITLENQPELINDEPYGEGWMIVIEPSDPAAWDQLMNAVDYRAYIAEEGAS